MGPPRHNLQSLPAVVGPAGQRSMRRNCIVEKGLDESEPCAFGQDTKCSAEGTASNNVGERIRSAAPARRKKLGSTIVDIVFWIYRNRVKPNERSLRGVSVLSGRRRFSW